jgi:hypothetical protein
MMIRRTATALTARSRLRTATVASRTQMLSAASHLRTVYSESSSNAFSSLLQPEAMTTSSLNMQKSWLSTSSVSVPAPPTSNHPHHKLEGAEGMIIYTETDEAPALATYSLYPVIAKVRILLVLGRIRSTITYRWMECRLVRDVHSIPHTVHMLCHVILVCFLVWCTGQY